MQLNFVRKMENLLFFGSEMEVKLSKSGVGYRFHFIQHWRTYLAERSVTTPQSALFVTDEIFESIVQHTNERKSTYIRLQE